MNELLVQDRIRPTHDERIHCGPLLDHSEQRREATLYNRIYWVGRLQALRGSYQPMLFIPAKAIVAEQERRFAQELIRLCKKVKRSE